MNKLNLNILKVFKSTTQIMGLCFAMLFMMVCTSNSGGDGSGGNGNGDGLKASDGIALFRLLEQQTGNSIAGASSNICQTTLDGTEATNLKNRGYTKAVLFGSTSSYDFINIATDTDALGIGQDITARNVFVFKALDLKSNREPSTMFNNGNGTSMLSLGELLAITPTPLSNPDYALFTHRTRVSSALTSLGIRDGEDSNAFWSFTNEAGMKSTYSCTSSNSITVPVGYNDDIGSGSSNNSPHVKCNKSLYVVCIAR